MRAIFSLIGLVFDLIILALAAAVMYVAIQPSFFFDNIGVVDPYLDDNKMRLWIGLGALVFFIMAFRGFFLLIFGRKERLFTIKESEHGTLTISLNTLEQIVKRIGSAQTPAADISSISINQFDSALRAKIKIKLEINQTNLGEYIAKFDGEVREYFKNSLGIEISRLDIEAATEPDSGDML